MATGRHPSRSTSIRTPTPPTPPEDRFRSGIIVTAAGMAVASLVAWLALSAP